MKSRHIVLSSSALVLLYLLCVAGSWPAAIAQENENVAEKKQSSAGPQVALQTVYLQEPIGRAHRIVVQGALGGAGRVTLDGNVCTVTQFGDPGVCTKITFQPIDVKLVQVRLADPSGQGRRLYQLQGDLEPPGYKYFLVVPRRRSEPHRLIVDMENDRRRVVTLEPVPAPVPQRGKPELCKHGEYRAEQSAGKVTVIAKGEHPTAGRKVIFEQLPIAIFPPQFRLVCVSPTGLAAQVIKPFEVKTSFPADQPIKQVIVHDGRGQHRVPVVQMKE